MQSKRLFPFFLLLMFLSCDNAKWTVIKGNGIPSGGETLNNVIYFENELTGLIGGYRWKETKSSNITDGIERVPILYYTEDGGISWKTINFSRIRNEGVNDVYLSQDSLICRIDTLILISTDLGVNWSIADTTLQRSFQKKFKKQNLLQIKNRNFLYYNRKYRVKESYTHGQTQVIVCYGKKSRTNYYFVSKDNGESWSFLQEEYGSNKRKFLLNGEYLFAYESPFGLQKLKL